MATYYHRHWKTPSGAAKSAWVVEWNLRGKRRRKQFPTERKARKYIETLSVVNDAAGNVPDPNAPTVEVVANEWLRMREAGLDGNPPIDRETAVWYRGLIDNHIAPALGPLRIGEVTKAHIRDFREHLLQGSPELTAPLAGPEASGGGRRPTAAGLRASGPPARTQSVIGRRTAQKALTALRTIFRHALETELIQMDPTQAVTIRFSKREVREIEIHDAATVRELLVRAADLRDTAPTRARRHWRETFYPMLLVLAYCGLRISEVRGLDVKDVDFARGVLRVRQRADKRGRLGAPKSRQSHREVHFPQIVEEALKPLVENKVTGLVFTTRSGRPVDPANFRKRCWEYVQAACRVEPKTLHSLRHFFASRQIQAGVNPKELAGLLGHADEAFTLKTYGHLFKDAETEARRRERAEALVL